MPYRRLPNTNRARVRAMEKALKKCLSEGQENCAISEPVYLLLESILPEFQHALINLEAARKKDEHPAAHHWGDSVDHLTDLQNAEQRPRAG